VCAHKAEDNPVLASQYTQAHPLSPSFTAWPLAGTNAWNFWTKFGFSLFRGCGITQQRRIEVNFLFYY